MDDNIALRTMISLLLPMGLIFFSRRVGFLKSGDERVFSAYLYYSALPPLFLSTWLKPISLQKISDLWLQELSVFAVLPFYFFLYLIFRFLKDSLYLPVLNTVSGSLAFLTEVCQSHNLKYPAFSIRAYLGKWETHA